MPELEVLKGLSQREASNILATAARLLSPQAEEPNQSSKEARLAKDLLLDVRKSLGISADDESEESLGRLNEAITSYILNLLLSKESFEAAVNRASSKGQLPVNAYSISRHSDFHGVRPNQIDGALRSPDLVKHIASEYDISRGFPQLSLFAKFSKQAFGIEDRWLVVSAARIGRTLEVYTAWWVFPSLTGISEYNDPIEVLLAFLGIFGIPIRVGRREGLLIETAEVDFDPSDTTFEPIKVIGKVDRFLLSGVALNDDTLGRFLVRMAYAVDTERYDRFLASKGLLSAQKIRQDRFSFTRKKVEAVVKDISEITP